MPWIMWIFGGTSNYFSTVYQELFFNWAKNYFLRYSEFIFWSTMHCGPCISSGLVRVFDFLGRPFENFASGGVLSKRLPRRNIVRERNERGFHLSYKICQELVVWSSGRSSGRSSRFYSRRVSTRSIARWTRGRRPSLSAMLQYTSLTGKFDWFIYIYVVALLAIYLRYLTLDRLIHLGILKT